MRRTFVVGCPRSGTTIVQALLARHPAVYTLPETGFFADVHGELPWRWGDAQARPNTRLKQRLGFTRHFARAAFIKLHLQLAGCRPLRPASLRTTGLGLRFLALLDRTTAAAGRSMWLEKTPNHLLYIPEIEALAPDARFVHVIRRGTDVVASVADAYLRFENDAAFGGGSVLWARRWNRAMEIHGQHVGRAHHHFVFHEDLVHQPEAAWARLCAFLDLPVDAPLDPACQQSIADIEQEPWKRAAIQGRVREASSKVDSLFGPTMQQWLQSHLAPYEDLRAQCVSMGRRSPPRLHVACDTRSARRPAGRPATPTARLNRSAPVPRWRD